MKDKYEKEIKELKEQNFVQLQMNEEKTKHESDQLFENLKSEMKNETDKEVKKIVEKNARKRK